jgi:hypothetical protein
VVNSPPVRIWIRKGLEVQDDALALRTIRDLHELESVRGIWESWSMPRNRADSERATGCHLDRPVANAGSSASDCAHSQFASPKCSSSRYFRRAPFSGARSAIGAWGSGRHGILILVGNLLFSFMLKHDV